jgi:hypothetical protein
MLHDANNMVEPIRNRLRIRDRTEIAVHDVISAVRHKRLFAGHSQRWIRAQGAQLALRRLPSKRNDFHRNGNERTDALNNLRFIRDHRQTLGSRLHNLFPQ